MSQLETPITHRYWERVGGTLIVEFLAVPSSPGVGRRLLDGLIVFDGQNRITKSQNVSLDGHVVIVVQTKATRLGMSLLGQALFSRLLIEERFSARSVRSVALCTADDLILRPLADRFGIEVVVDTPAK